MHFAVANVADADDADAAFPQTSKGLKMKLSKKTQTVYMRT